MAVQVARACQQTLIFPLQNGSKPTAGLLYCYHCNYLHHYNIWTIHLKVYKPGTLRRQILAQPDCEFPERGLNEYFVDSCVINSNLARDGLRSILHVGAKISHQTTRRPNGVTPMGSHLPGSNKGGSKNSVF